MMAASASMATVFVVSFIILIGCVGASSSSFPNCDVRQPNLWLNDLRGVSPVYYSPLNSPLQVDGDFLDLMVSKLGSGHIAVLFHASWCLFSRETRPIFETLSYMFPEIEHLTVEQSSAMPSVLSRYGVHSFPSILLINNSSSVPYHGPRDLSSLIEFYMKSTGAEPIQYLIPTDHLTSLSNERADLLMSSNSSLREFLSREPYLAFSILFIILRLVHFTLPTALACAKSLWSRFIIPQMNLEIFGETSQIFNRTLHMIDVKRFWTKLKLCKTRSFHQRARSARVWASSLASVSVGENYNSSPNR